MTSFLELDRSFVISKIKKQGQLFCVLLSDKKSIQIIQKQKDWAVAQCYLLHLRASSTDYLSHPQYKKKQYKELWLHQQITHHIPNT